MVKRMGKTYINLLEQSYDGDYTYFKGNAKSQIDYVYTNKAGLGVIKSLTIYKENWHLSDHLPIGVTLHTAM